MNCKYSQLDKLGAGIDVIGEMKNTKSTSAPPQPFLSTQEDTPTYLYDGSLDQYYLIEPKL